MKEKIEELITEYKRKHKYCKELSENYLMSGAIANAERVRGKEEAYKAIALDLEQLLGGGNNIELREAFDDMVSGFDQLLMEAGNVNKAKDFTFVKRIYELLNK